MGRYSSSLTRVRPVFEALQRQELATWLPELWRMAATRKAGAVPPPGTTGPLLPGEIYERSLPPSTTFLRWMVRHPAKLTMPGPDYGATSATARQKRAELFSPDTTLTEAAMREALDAIQAHGGAGSARQWWAFEGFTYADACFETAECLLLIEGKRTEAVSPSTRWFVSRNQLWRNVEVARELAKDRPFGLILAVETEEAGRTALQEAAASRDSSYPHLPKDDREELDRHLLGFVLWAEVVSRFGLPPSVLLDAQEGV